MTAGFGLTIAAVGTGVLCKAPDSEGKDPRSIVCGGEFFPYSVDEMDTIMDVLMIRMMKINPNIRLMSVSSMS
jgi:hypothetical protein